MKDYGFVSYAEEELGIALDELIAGYAAFIADCEYFDAEISAEASGIYNF